MSQTISLKAALREGRASAVRRQGLIPGIIYGRGLDSTSVQVDARQFGQAFDKVGRTSLLQLAVGSDQHNVLVREIQLHPLKNNVVHVDFLEVRMDEKVQADVPLMFTGESAAVKDLAGILVHNMDAISVEALPQDLPHNIAVDISGLTDFDRVIHVSELVLPSGVTILNSPAEVVVLVQKPRSEEELQQLSEEAKEDVQSVEGIKEEPEETEDESKAQAASEKKE